MMPTPMEKYDACTALQRSGQVAEAVDALKKLTEEHPDFALAYNALAAWHKKNGDLDEAVRNAEKYCELEPDDAFGYSILSSYSLAAGMREKAEDALGRAQDLRFRAHFEGRTV